MKRFLFYKNSFLFVLGIFLSAEAFTQDPVIRPGTLRRPATGNPSTQNDNAPARGNRGGDSAASNVERREYADDSLQVSVYTLSSARATTFDTSIRDYTLRFPIPPTHVYLGNDGSATRSLLFFTPQRTGWDPGFHSHDVYKWKLENIRFYNTPRPYTELGYMLASGQTQMIDILHTQNIRPYWNAAFQYRLLGSPGTFRNQKNSHRNYQITSWYQSQNKRYNNYFVILNNKIQSGESGGIRTDKDYLNDPIYERRFTVPTNIGGSPSATGDLFSTVLTTGRREKEFNFLLRQQYDFGRKDSLVTDSLVIPLFYPRLRFEHTLRYGNYSYLFQDIPASGNTKNVLDSTFYRNAYDILINTTADSVSLQDSWREWSNDFSVYQFPDANNLQQFIKLGIELQLLKGTLKNANPSLYNIIAHGEYRNRTKNQKWDINAFGRLHTTGNNFG
ncbi:MAG TPA: putative porin, partial [Flavisolibacter sp.]